MIHLSEYAIVACTLFLFLSAVAFGVWKEDIAAGAFVFFILMFVMVLLASMSPT